MLEFPNFKYCAFKNLLAKALNISIKEDNKQEEKDNQAESKRTFSMNKTNTIRRNMEVDEDNVNNHNNYLENQDKEINPDKLILNDNKPTTQREMNELDINIPIPIPKPEVLSKQNISFKVFCDIMKLFNDRFPVDLKINCISDYKNSLF
jgi:hypothetical protein